MKFKSENPIQKYAAVYHKGKAMFFDKSDNCSETLENAKSFCSEHSYSDTDTVNSIYYLRGRLHKSAYNKTLKGILFGDNLPEELFEIIHCLTFWNQEGDKCYTMNKNGDESYSDFILRCVAADCRAFVNAYPEQFITGKGGSHVWVDNRGTNESILMIHF